MEICKYKNTIRIIILDDSVEFMPCGIIDYDKECNKGLTSKYKIKDLSDNLQKEVDEVFPKCYGSTLKCKRKSFKFRKIEIYIKTSNKKSIKTILDKAKNNALSHIIFWSTPSNKIDNFVFKYIQTLKSDNTKNIIFRAQRIFNNKKIKSAIVRTFEENIYFEVIYDIIDVEKTINKFHLKKLLGNLKLLQKYKLIKKITIPIADKKGFRKIVEKLKNTLPEKYFSIINFYPKTYLANFKKFESGNIFGNYNPVLFEEQLRGYEPYIIRYKGPKSNLDINTFEVVGPDRKKIAEVNRANISEITKVLSKDKNINLFLDLKSNYNIQTKDYLLIMELLKDHPIFELTLGKSEILKFESYKVLYYLATQYFLIIESLNPDPELITNFKSTLDFKVYGVIEDIKDWNKFQPLVEQKYIDRIIYIEYEKDNLETLKEELKNYYSYIEGISSILYDRFYIYPDYLIEDDEEFMKFFIEHNKERRPYYDE